MIRAARTRNDYWVQLPIRASLDVSIGRDAIACSPRRAVSCHPRTTTTISCAPTRDPLMFTMQGVTAFGHFFAGRYEEAISWAEKAFWERPNILATLRVAAASYALAGRLEEARKAVARALELDPDMRLSN